MVTIKDGPAAGATLMLQRAPRLLRVTVKIPAAAALFDPVTQRPPGATARLAAAGFTAPRADVDALDQVDDVAEPGEAIHVYRRGRYDGRMHLNGGTPARSGFYAVAEYWHLPDVDGEALRDRDAWQTWATLNQHRAPAPARTEAPA